MPFAGLALGRSVVVGPGEPAPAEWGGCERVVVGAVESDVADRLALAWRSRQSVVIELTPGLGLDDPGRPLAETVSGLQPWEWSVALDLVGERLHHALWSNAVDGRGGGRFWWGWGEVAVRLGASTGDGAGFGDADVVLPDGTRAVCDGGPFDAGLASRLGTAVVHRIALEHGSLRAVGPGASGVGASGVGASASELAGSLAPDQLAAVTEPAAGARVIAPAGSGKTRVLTARARLLLEEWGVPPEAVALVAYNVRAANEMRDRLSDVPGARIRTLNALGLRLCGRRSTIDELEVRRLLSELVSFPRRAETDPAAPWIEALSRLRLGLVAPGDVESELPDVSDLDRVVRTYRSELAERDVVDFDDQVVAAIERLLADPAFRQRSQRFARILLVDEFQDLTPAHLLLLRLLAGPAGAVYGVGDDDQTIYGYAGATPRWLVDFEQWFPGSGSHSLEVNYRCPAAVVTAASNVLTRNAVRVPKTIRAASTSSAGGLEVDADDGGGGPAARTVGRVSALVASGVDPAGVAVLARVNASLVPVHVLLRHAGVVVDSPVDRRFLQRGGVRAALAWLEVATASDSHLPGSMLREAARRPKRGMSQSLLDLVAKQRSLLALERLAGWLEGKGSSREADKVREFGDDVSLVRDTPGGATTSDILMVVRSKIGDGGLDGSAAALDQWSHGALAAHTDDLDALMELADLEPDPSRFPRWLEDQLSPSPDERAPTGLAGVTLASIHAVKGREWPHVVLHHVTDGLMPHRLAVDLEEERRVFHVGITRGRDSVCIVAGSPASPYVAEMAAPGEPPAAGTPAAGAAVGLAAGLARRGAAPASPVARSSGGTAELMPATVGLVFGWRGHDHAVSSTAERGLAATVAGGSATTSVPYGSVVTVGGRSVLLGHPGAESAWTRLRAWRGDRAKALGKPAFVIFDDKTLRAVAAVLPSTERELLSIGGIGPVKLEAYGVELLAIVEAVRGGAGEGGR